MEKDGFRSVIAFYSWILQTHQHIKYSTKLTQNQVDEIIGAVSRSLTAGSDDNQRRCVIF